ncbi:hypothetical protein WCD74_07280 [Actinomycetospora sp. OC33-EN08]|uniref:DUF4333 domain-containing protein n=1 Tax=Actinomycetospora aurantiaca TaxID=3129233 RepID=A0ABU8MMA7_9PSEU
MASPSVFPPPPDEEATVRTAPPEIGSGRPLAATVAVTLWWVVLGLGVVTQLVVVAAGGLTLTSTAPNESARVFLLVLVAVLFALPPVAHWLVLVWATRRLQQGRGRPRPFLTVLALSSVVFDVFPVVTLDRTLPVVLSVVHAVAVLAAVVTTWLPDVSTWLAGPVALAPSPPTSAAPAGLAAVPVPTAERPRRARPALAAGIVVGALLALVGHTVLGIGGSSRVSLEQTISAGIVEQSGYAVQSARCPWALGWDLATGGAGSSSCTADVNGRTYPVEVTSGPGGARWQLVT